MRIYRQSNRLLVRGCCRFLRGGFSLLSYRLLSSSSSPPPSALSAAHADALSVAVLTGTTRRDGPPPILGPRVSEFIVNNLERRGNSVTLLDPLELQLPLLEKPEFAYARSRVPEQLREIQQELSAADAYVCITPEYNHAPSPGLLNLLNHFGSSTFSFKPSAIVSYSAGQWGGTRAANALRPILSELGCLPVSAMIHIPKAQEALNDDGKVHGRDNQAEWESYVDRCFSQLEWWADAARRHRQDVDPFEESPAFQKNPSQRDAPR